MNQNLILAIALCVASSAIGAKLPGTQIVGGVEAAKNQFPHLVRLWVPSGATARFCSGTLIALDVVLTSASCLENNNKQVIVTAGDHSVIEADGTEQSLTSQEVITHENFNSTGRLRNDIALIKLSGKFKQTDAVRPIALPTALINTDNSEYGIAAGWGATVVGEENEDELHTANVTTFRNDLCATLVELDDGDFCTLDTKGGLQSDNGGPLICSENLEVVCGIMSSSSEVGDENEILGMYVNVSFYLEWIGANIPIEPTTTTASTTDTSSTTTEPSETSTTAGSARFGAGLLLMLVSLMTIL